MGDLLDGLGAGLVPEIMNPFSFENTPEAFDRHPVNLCIHRAGRPVQTSLIKGVATTS